LSTAILIILDGLGVGGAPDAEEYGDVGSDTLGNMSRVMDGINVPTLASLGLGNLSQIQNVPPSENPCGTYGRLEEISCGKDSTTGHWELMGVHTSVAFPTYEGGFPEDLLAEFSKRTGYGVIGNKAASGTDIIEELGDQHIASRDLIVYTSADSVFQIAAHDDVCDIDELYRVCAIAREMFVEPHNISRVIARPFTGKSGEYARTPYRKDYSVNPPSSMILPALQQSGVVIESIGKIYDLYNGFGIGQSHVSKSNAEGMENLARLYSEKTDGDRLILLNLVDFDMLWGHRNDPKGMKEGLEIFDQWLEGFLQQMQDGDLLMMTADHGNDPTTPGSDHSREHVPMLAYMAGEAGGNNVGTRKGFMDLGATLIEYFGREIECNGVSFYSQLKN